MYVFNVRPKILMTYKSCRAVVKIIIENDTFLYDLLDLLIKSLENYTLTTGKKGIGIFLHSRTIYTNFHRAELHFYRILLILCLFHSLTIFTNESL